MKRCTHCKTEKPEVEFSSKRRATDGKSSWCRECFKENWRKRYYTNHDFYKQRHAESRNRLRNEKARMVYEYLKLHPCVDCGESDPVILEFDHKIDSDKVDSVTQMILNNNSWEKISAEMQKCYVRCANCHRRRTAARFNYRRFLFREQ